MGALKFSPPFLFLATVPLGLILGGAGSLLTLLATPLALCAFDACFKSSFGGKQDRFGALATWLPALYACLQVGVGFSVCLLIAFGRLTPLQIVGSTLSVGLTAGVFGNVAAHDLIHRTSRLERGLGLLMLACVANMQFRIAHIHGHHRRAATDKDPASARRGESAYSFVGRSLRGQFKEAWDFERARSRRRPRAEINLSNRLVHYLIIELTLGLVVAALGPAAFLFWVGQALIAIVMMELFNYIAHYGLTRRRISSMGFERLGPQHSWNTNRRMNNWSLFNMGRHSDHHRHPAGGYQALQGDAFAPELPAGYAGAILLCLMPPLWRRVMDPLVSVWTGIDASPQALQKAAAAQARILRRV